MMPSSHLILWCSLLLLPSIFPSTRDFSNVLAICIRWPNIRASASGSVFPMNVHGWFLLGLIGLIFLQLCCCSVTQSCLTLCDPMDYTTPGLPVPHPLHKFSQVNIHCIGDAIQPSHPLMLSSPSALNLSLHQGLFQRVGCSHQMTKILEFQLQHQSCQWIFRADL